MICTHVVSIHTIYKIKYYMPYYTIHYTYYILLYTIYILYTILYKLIVYKEHFDTRDDTPNSKLYAREIQVKNLINYPYMIIMPAGSKTLHTIIASEHIAGKEWLKVKEIAIELAEALDHLHSNGVVHGDVKPLNIMRCGNTIKLIDLDAAASIDTGYVGAKYSSAYVPPEMIYVRDRTVTTNTNNSNKTLQNATNNPQDSSAIITKEKEVIVKSYTIDPVSDEILYKHLPYTLIKANYSYDSWAYGVVLFELFTGKKLLFANFEDNVDMNDLYDVYQFNTIFKQRKLYTITDPLARNLVSQLLTKDPLKRPSMRQVLGMYSIYIYMCLYASMCMGPCIYMHACVIQ